MRVVNPRGKSNGARRAPARAGDYGNSCLGDGFSRLRPAAGSTAAHAAARLGGFENCCCGGGEHQMVPHPGGRRAKALRASAGGSVTVEFFSCVLGLLTAPLEDAQIL